MKKVLAGFVIPPPPCGLVPLSQGDKVDVDASFGDSRKEVGEIKKSSIFVL